MGRDNKSCVLLEKNGKASSSKRAKHTNIRHFFVTDRIQNKELKVFCCPTNDMVADLFTKPLQGHKFKKFRKIIVNVPDPEEISQKKKLNKQACESNDATIGHRSVLDKKQKKQAQCYMVSMSQGGSIPTMAAHHSGFSNGHDSMSFGPMRLKIGPMQRGRTDARC